jgi:hypothetical protein
VAPPPPTPALKTIRSPNGADFFRPQVKTDALKVNAVKERVKKEQVECNPLLPQPPFLVPIVAPRKSGKTTLLVDSLLDEGKYCHKFDIIIVWSRTYHHDSKWKNIKLPPGSIFTAFDESEIETLLKVAEKVAKTMVVNTLFIFDDMITENIMNSRKMGTIEAVAVRGRHANVSIIIITQQYMALSPAVRNNSTNTIFFRIRNGDELEKIAKENRESLSVDEFMTLYNYATEDPFAFLHVNNQEADPKKRFYKNWDTSLELVPKF